VARNPDYWKKGRPYLDWFELAVDIDLLQLV